MTERDYRGKTKVGKAHPGSRHRTGDVRAGRVDAMRSGPVADSLVLIISIILTAGEVAARKARP
jgi:hypothetical protein